MRLKPFSSPNIEIDVGEIVPKHEAAYKHKPPKIAAFAEKKAQKTKLLRTLAQIGHNIGHFFAEIHLCQTH
ncbi:hypothetical protein GCM10025855_11670 [Shewanella glacialipiscicola]|uniref:Uncharacterized protein n=1 Tax=Shewanella glacialipiscicola TaxID=614069 RepID=A0ABQ6J319_9GAMM|nr:hypothetical protein GCM10025855_11670 [Shewanella glacialipiscicola]